MPNSANKNQAFLKEMEKQRLNKECKRAINLKGKVPGECQAYELGGLVHYLDDRGYLILKQLLARFDGRYTVGVYETLLKAVKKLEQAEQANAENTTDDKPKYLNFSQHIRRGEERVLHTTPVTIKVRDLVYNGYTLDISVTALKISLKRTYSLEVGDIVSVQLTDYINDQSPSFLHQLKYKVIKLDHDDQNTFIILFRKSTDHPQVTEWLQDWVSKNVNRKQINVDNEILNALSETYFKLWLNRFTAPLIWLQQNEAERQILTTHQSTLASHMMASLPLGKTPAISKLVPPSSVPLDQDYLILIEADESWVSPVNDDKAIQQLFSWHKKSTHSDLLLLKARNIKLDISQFDAELQPLYSLGETQANLELNKLKQLAAVVSIHHISRLNQFFATDTQITKQDIAHLSHPNQLVDANLPSPRTLTPEIKRYSQRYFAKIDLTIEVAGEKSTVLSYDLSAYGVTIELPKHLKVKLGERVLVSFESLQKKAKETNLSQLPYQVENISFVNDHYRVGLQRQKNRCPASLNVFFEKLIEENKDRLRENHNDVIYSSKNKVYIELLRSALHTTALFIGLNKAGRRSFQIIGESPLNQAKLLKQGLLESLEELIPELSERIKLLGSNSEVYAQTFIYTYFDQSNQWHSKLEDSFTSTSEKQRYIERASTSDSFRCFQCQLIPITALSSSSERELVDHFLKWHAKHANRIKDIRYQLNNLIGLFELNDVTELVVSLNKSVS